MPDAVYFFRSTLALNGITCELQLGDEKFKILLQL